MTAADTINRTLGEQRRRIQTLEQQLAAKETEIRSLRARVGAAEKNARQFHAMMLQARVQLIEKKGTAA